MIHVMRKAFFGSFEIYVNRDEIALATLFSQCFFKGFHTTVMTERGKGYLADMCRLILIGQSCTIPRVGFRVTCSNVYYEMYVT